MKFAKLLTALLLCTTLGFTKEPKIDLNLADLSISEFIKMVSKITKKNILITDPIAGKIDFISDHGITRNELYVLLQSVLQSKGFTLVESDGFLTTVRIADASKAAPPLETSDIAQIHTQIIQVKTADANTLSAQLRYLLSNTGKLVVSKENNAFIVTDYPQNTRIIKELIDKLDQDQNQHIAFIELKHVKVNSIFAEFTKIVGALYNQQIVQQKVGIFKNDPTNMIILVAAQAHIERLKTFIEKLDKPDKVTQQRLALMALKNADAEAVVAILNDIIAKKVYPAGEIKPSISADKELNSLIIIASGEEIEDFEKLLEELDKERQQVYVRARVMEISKKRTDELGLKYGFGGAAVADNTLYTLTSNLGGAIPAASAISSVGANKALSVNINFLLANNAAKSVSEPSLLCINNKESTIYVGNTQSISSGTTNNAISGTIQNFTREDIGLTLKIKPRIANDDKVTLEVETKLEDVLPSESATLPTTTKREVKTTAIVKDGESIIIGGLIRESTSSATTKIPLLGDIPLFGALFRSTSKISDEINLVVILTPYIISKSGDLSHLRAKLARLSEIEAEFAEQTLSKLKKP